MRFIAESTIRVKSCSGISVSSKLPSTICDSDISPRRQSRAMTEDPEQPPLIHHYCVIGSMNQRSRSRKCRRLPEHCPLPHVSFNTQKAPNLLPLPLIDLNLRSDCDPHYRIRAKSSLTGSNPTNGVSPLMG